MNNSNKLDQAIKDFGSGSYKPTFETLVECHFYLKLRKFRYFLRVKNFLKPATQFTHKNNL